MGGVELGEDDGGVIADLLRAVRAHFGMDVAFVSEFTEGRRVFRFVDTGAESFVVPGAGEPLERTYCKYVVDGVLPSAIPDTATNQAVIDLQIPTPAGVASYLGVPITFPDGRVYGTLCCLGSAPAEIGLGDLAILSVVADVVAANLQRIEDHLEDVVASHQRVADIIDGEEFHPVFQPIVDLVTGRVVGVEALTRFTAEPQQSPDKWFHAANAAGLGVELELAAVRKALAQLPSIPDGAYMSVNLSPAVLAEALELLSAVDCTRVVVEITEHEQIADYDALIATTVELRARGIRFAVDDAGSGYSSLSHVLRLRPDIVKLDLALVRDVDADLARQALARALVEFATNFGATIVAEGIETAAELRILARLGVASGQGYHLARPGPLPIPDVSVVVGAHEIAPRDALDAVHFVFRKNPMALTIATAEGRFVVANEAASKIYGRPIEAFPGHSWNDFGAVANEEEIVESYTRVIDGETDAAVFPMAVPRPDGTCARVMVNGRAIRDAAGELVWFFNILEPVEA